MAKLPQYRQQAVAQAAAPGAALVNTSTIRGLQQLAQGVTDVARIQTQMQEREARDYRLTSQNQTTVALAQEKTNLTANSRTGSEYANGVKTFIEQQRDKAIEDAPNPRAAEQVRQYYDALGATEMESAVGVAAKINAENTAEITRTTLNISFNDTFQNPGNYETQLASGAQVIGMSDLSDQQKEKAIKAYANELTVYRFQGLIKQNPALAKKELDDGEFNYILTTDQLMKLSQSADQQVQAQGAATKQKVSGEISDYIAYKSAGGQNKTEYSEANLHAIYGPEQGSAVFNQIQDVNSFAENFGRVELASAEEIGALIDAEKVNGPEDYRTQAQQESTMIRAVTERNKQLSNDPALYSMKSGNVQGAFELYQASGDGKSYAIATTSEQLRLGVPNEYLSVMGKKQASAIVAEYNQGGEDAATMLAQLKQQFGDYFPIVMRDLNRAGLSPHASLVSVLDGAPATYLSQADKAGYKVMADNVGKDNLKDIKDLSKAYIDDNFTNTVNGTPSGIAMKNQMNKSLELLSMYYLDSGMVDSASDASEKAYDGLINSRYTFQDNYRVPTKVGNYEPDSIKIENSLDALMDGVMDLDLMPPFDPSMPEEQRLEVYKLRLQPKWQTRGDDAGVELVDQNQQAVLTSDGQKIFYPWQELEDMDQSKRFNFFGLGGL